MARERHYTSVMRVFKVIFSTGPCGIYACVTMDYIHWQLSKGPLSYILTYQGIMFGLNDLGHFKSSYLKATASVIGLR